MIDFIKIEWKTKKKEKIKKRILTEDFSIFDNEKEYIVVADGVTRDVYEKYGKSPAYNAAKLAVTSCASCFVKPVKDSRKAIKGGFEKANEKIRELNKKENLWGEGNNDYLDRDLAGTCLACILKRENKIFYGYVGDCRIFKVSKDKKLFITKDVVKEAKLKFPKIKDKEKKIVLIRKERRNNPKSPHKTYGVLTGEKEALNKKYFGVGDFSYKKGDIVGVFSDGVAPFVEKDKKFLELLFSGTKKEIKDYVLNLNSPLQNEDEKTLIFFKS